MTLTKAQIEGIKKSHPMWVDADGEFHPWIEEFWAWAKAEQEKRGPYNIHEKRIKHDVKLSDVLRFLSAARACPEVWDRYVELAARKAPDYALDEGDFDEIRELTNCFTDWFRMKHGLRDQEIPPWAGVPRVLWGMAIGTIAEGDVAAIKAEISRYYLIDDVSDSSAL